MLKAAMIATGMFGTSALFTNLALYTSEAGSTSAVSVTESEHEHSETQGSTSTLWGIYGVHSLHDCPVNNKETAEYVVAASKADLGPLQDKYGVVEIHDRYHSGLEHTFLWAVETTRPHDLEEFAIELGIASWNDLKFVPLRTFEEGVAPVVAELHGIDD